jgi:RNA polymerase sigma-70 factor (ECF subfamily)
MHSQDDFIRAYDEYSDALFRYCYYRVYNRERALEIAQDTFMKAWEYVSKTDKEIENLRAFLYKIAKNLLIDESRKKKIRPTSSLDDLQEKGFDPGKDPTGAMKTLIDNRETLKAIEQLEPKYKEAVWLRYMDDMSVKDIAVVLEDNENNVSVKIHRGLKQLRNLIEQ